MKEIFKDIIGYEKLYKISNLGNVLSLSKNDGNGYRDRLLKQEVCKKDHTNYRRVTLSKNGKIKRFQIHRLVALHFINNKNNKPFVNHKDSNGENNNVDNLEWCTQSENMKHSQKEKRSYSYEEMARKAKLCAKSKIEKRNKKSIENFGKIFGFIQIQNETREIIGNKRTGQKRFQYKCKCIRCNNREAWKEIYLLKSGKYVQCISCTAKYGKETLETLTEKGLI